MARQGHECIWSDLPRPESLRTEDPVENGRKSAKSLPPGLKVDPSHRWGPTVTWTEKGWVSGRQAKFVEYVRPRSPRAQRPELKTCAGCGVQYRWDRHLDRCRGRTAAPRATVDMPQEE